MDLKFFKHFPIIALVILLSACISKLGGNNDNAPNGDEFGGGNCPECDGYYPSTPTDFMITLDDAVGLVTASSSSAIPALKAAQSSGDEEALGGLYAIQESGDGTDSFEPVITLEEKSGEPDVEDPGADHDPNPNEYDFPEVKGMKMIPVQTDVGTDCKLVISLQDPFCVNLADADLTDVSDIDCWSAQSDYTCSMFVVQETSDGSQEKLCAEGKMRLADWGNQQKILYQGNDVYYMAYAEQDGGQANLMRYDLATNERDFVQESDECWIGDFFVDPNATSDRHGIYFVQNCPDSGGFYFIDATTGARLQLKDDQTWNIDEKRVSFLTNGNILFFRNDPNNSGSDNWSEHLYEFDPTLQLALREVKGEPYCSDDPDGAIWLQTLPQPDLDEDGNLQYTENGEIQYVVDAERNPIETTSTPELCLLLGNYWHGNYCGFGTDKDGNRTCENYVDGPTDEDSCIASSLTTKKSISVDNPDYDSNDSTSLPTLTVCATMDETTGKLIAYTDSSGNYVGYEDPSNPDNDGANCPDIVTQSHYWCERGFNEITDPRNAFYKRAKAEGGWQEQTQYTCENSIIEMRNSDNQRVVATENDKILISGTFVKRPTGTWYCDFKREGGYCNSYSGILWNDPNSAEAKALLSITDPEVCMSGTSEVCATGSDGTEQCFTFRMEDDDHYYWEGPIHDLEGKPGYCVRNRWDPNNQEGVDSYIATVTTKSECKAIRNEDDGYTQSPYGVCYCHTNDSNDNIDSTTTYPSRTSCKNASIPNGGWCDWKQDWTWWNDYSLINTSDFWYSRTGDECNATAIASNTDTYMGGWCQYDYSDSGGDEEFQGIAEVGDALQLNLVVDSGGSNGIGDVDEFYSVGKHLILATTTSGGERFVNAIDQKSYNSKTNATTWDAQTLFFYAKIINIEEISCTEDGSDCSYQAYIRNDTNNDVEYYTITRTVSASTSDIEPSLTNYTVSYALTGPVEIDLDIQSVLRFNTASDTGTSCTGLGLQ